MPVKYTSLDFSDMSGGKNNAQPRNSLAQNQVYDTVNLIHDNLGVYQSPGYSKISGAGFSSGTYKHFLGKYVTDDGIEYLIFGLMVIVSPTDERRILLHTRDGTTFTQFGEIQGSGECYCVNAAGRLWIANGTWLYYVKEDPNNVNLLSAYRAQITQLDSGAAVAQATAGGTLPDGTYICYASLARKDDSGRYLYSLPISAGTVVCGSGNNTITASVAFASANLNTEEFTHIVFFCTVAGGSVPYYAGEAEYVGNIGETIVVDSTADINTQIYMSVVAAPNQQIPISPSAIFTFDDKLFIWEKNKNTIYWSLKTDINPFELERFLQENFRVVSYSINSMFNVNEHIYLNHIGNGITVIPNGDLSAAIKSVDRSLWFLDCITDGPKTNVCYYKGIAIGITNDGVRMFNGAFSEDLSSNIKPDIDKLIAGISDDHIPCAVVNRRSNSRTEYRLSYRDLDNGIRSNNTQRILNLDFYFDVANPRVCWESWECGFASMTYITGKFFGLMRSTVQLIATESGVVHNNFIDKGGNHVQTTQTKKWSLITRTHIGALDSLSVWGNPYVLSTNKDDITGYAVVFENNYRKFLFVIPGNPITTGVLPPDGLGGLPLPFELVPQYPINTVDPLPFECRGYSIAFELGGQTDDENFFIYRIMLPRITLINNNLT